MTPTRLITVLATLALAGSLSACATDEGSTDASPSAASGEVVRMWIEPELAECTGVGPMECMQVAYAEGGEPELFYASIDGFEFVEGTSYVIDVEVTEIASPPADGSSLGYTLVEVVSQTPAQ